MSRDHFMNFFRNDEALATLSKDDRIFLHILPGASDITSEPLEELMRDYCGGNEERN